MPVVATTTISAPSRVASSSRPPSAQRSRARSRGRASLHQARASGQLGELRGELVARAPGGQPDQREATRGARRSPRASAARSTRSIRAGRPPVTGCSRRSAARSRRGRVRRRGTSRCGRARHRGPGTRKPDSLRPAARLTSDSARSPAWAASPMIGPITSGCHGVEPDQPGADPGGDGAGQQPADQPLHGLGRADVVDQPPSPEPASGQVGARSRSPTPPAGGGASRRSRRGGSAHRWASWRCRRPGPGERPPR